MRSTAPRAPSRRPFGAPLPPAPRRPAAGGEDGLTMVEVMVAMTILLVGVLGVLTVISTSARSTSRTVAREGGTNLARELVERSRQLPYAATVSGTAPARLRATLPASDAAGPLSGSTFTVTRRGVDYTVEITACSVDDPSDGAGLGDATFCAAPADGTPTGPGAPSPGLAVGLNVLGVSVASAGSVLRTVCAAVGTGAAVLSAVSSTATDLLRLAGADVQACPAGTTGSVALDTGPVDDLRRVRVDVRWTRDGAGAVAQTTLLTNPDQG